LIDSLLVIFIILLTAFILMLLHIIPSPFSFLSSKSNQINKNTLLPSSDKPEKESSLPRDIISKDKPYIYNNTEKKGVQNIIQNSSIVVTTPLTISTHLKVETDNKGKDVTNGILFTNDTSNTPAKPTQVNSLYLFYYLPSNTWTLRYRYQGENKYYTLYTNTGETKEGDFTLAVTKDGKTVKVTYKNGHRTISLPTSLYAITNSMLMNVQIASNATVRVSSLTYQ
jgi:hypothetical protein